MRFNQTAVSAAVLASMGMAGVVAMAPASAGLIADGVYHATVKATPITTFKGKTLFLFGSDGAWNTSFSFGSLPAATSQGSTDNSASIATPSGTRGSSVLGDGVGSWDMTVSGNNFTASNFQFDAIFTTAGGTFVQYASITGGTVDGLGNMTLDPTGRLGGVGGSFPTPGFLHDERWNVPPAGAAYLQMTSGMSTSPVGTLMGKIVTPIGDVNFDTLTDYNVILVLTGVVGNDWGSFAGATYTETWNVDIVSAVPVPAAAWLFGSGLLGLAGIARRKRSSGAPAA